jgi:hypothetical protein
MLGVHQASLEGRFSGKITPIRQSGSGVDPDLRSDG